MLVAFAHTGGLIGAEVGIAGGTAVLGPEGARGDLRRPGGARDGDQGAQAPARARAGAVCRGAGPLRPVPSTGVETRAGQARTPGRRGSSGEGGSMSPLKMGSKQVKAVSAEELTARSRGPRAGGGQPAVRELDPAAVAPPGPWSTRSASGSPRPATTPSSRSPAPRGRASPACSTHWSAPTVAVVGARRPDDLAARGRGLGRRGRHRAARLAVGVAAPPRGRRRRDRRDPGHALDPRRAGAARPARLRLAGGRPPRGVRAGARARGRVRVGHRPAEVRRRAAARRLPARARRRTTP